MSRVRTGVYCHGRTVTHLTQQAVPAAAYRLIDPDTGVRFDV